MNQYQLPIFENLCPAWENILHLGIRRTFLKGSQVFDIIAPIHGVYYITKGSVEVILLTQKGPEKALYYVGEGCIFGEVSCFVPGDSGEAMVRARSNCECYFFSRDTIEIKIAQMHPNLLIDLIRAAAYKIRMYGVMLQDSLNDDNFVRVCKMLVYLTRYREPEISNHQIQIHIKPDISQSDLAKLMGIHRVTVTKAIGRLKALQILSHYSKNSLIIDDFPALLKITRTDVYVSDNCH